MPPEWHYSGAMGSPLMLQRKRIVVYVDKDEKEAIDHKAASLGLSTSAFTRMAVRRVMKLKEELGFTEDIDI